MNTFFARNRLSPYLDGELSAEDARAVEAALAEDAELREELAVLRETAALLRGLDVRAPDGFAERVAARAALEPKPTAWRRWLRGVGGARSLVAVAAAAVFVFAAIGGLREPSADDSGNEPEAVAPAAAPADADAPPPLEPPPDAEPGDADLSGDLSGDLGDDAAPADPRPVPSDDASTARSLLSRTYGRASTEAAPATSGLPAGTTGKGKGERAGSWRGAAQASGIAPPPGGVEGGSSRASGRRGSAGTEREAYVADWESRGDVTAVAVTAPTVEYRVVSATESGLKELAAVARSLGGDVRDSRGDALAAYPMESGEARIVRVVVPASKLAALGARLSSVGEVQVVAETGAGMYAPDAKVPVRVEIVAP
jgi:hypothetical protein